MPLQTKELTWAEVDMDDAEERKRFFEQERRKAGERAAAAFQHLKDLGIVDEKGNLTPADLPEDMRPGAQRDFGG
jgi:hypothetical protein